ncbi:hypothetical protein LUU34_00328300 [Aix galericulata]|nr:hypothetical protein LUU34_00328300 [Aix galericulata]
MEIKFIPMKIKFILSFGPRQEVIHIQKTACKKSQPLCAKELIKCSTVQGRKFPSVAEELNALLQNFNKTDKTHINSYENYYNSDAITFNYFVNIESMSLEFKQTRTETCLDSGKAADDNPDQHDGPIFVQTAGISQFHSFREAQNYNFQKFWLNLIALAQTQWAESNTSLPNPITEQKEDFDTLVECIYSSSDTKDVLYFQTSIYFTFFFLIQDLCQVGRNDLRILLALLLLVVLLHFCGLCGLLGILSLLWSLLFLSCCSFSLLVFVFSFFIIDTVPLLLLAQFASHFGALKWKREREWAAEAMPYLQVCDSSFTYHNITRYRLIRCMHDLWFPHVNGRSRANIKTCLSHPPGHSFRKRKVSQHGARQRHSQCSPAKLQQPRQKEVFAAYNPIGWSITKQSSSLVRHSMP